MILFDEFNGFLGMVAFEFFLVVTHLHLIPKKKPLVRVLVNFRNLFLAWELGPSGGSKSKLPTNLVYFYFSLSLVLSKLVNLLRWLFLNEAGSCSHL